MNRNEENAVEIPTTPEPSVQIVYCQAHYDELVFALCERQLSQDIAQTPDELIQKLSTGQMDPALEASNAITSAALSTFGPAAVIESGGCPVCSFQNITSHVADHIAIKYRKAN